LPDLSLLRERLIKQAETVLRPGIAILIECAFEAEANAEAAEFLDGIIKSFNECAVKGEPLRSGAFEVFDMFVPAPAGDHDMVAVGLLTGATIAAETVEPCGKRLGEDGFIKYAAGRAIKLDLAGFAPAIIGIGIASTENEARLLSRVAMFRSPDRHSADDVTAEYERRILGMINRTGPGAGGFGGGHTALGVSIEQTGEGFVAICTGDYFTRSASGKI